MNQAEKDIREMVEKALPCKLYWDLDGHHCGGREIPLIESVHHDRCPARYKEEFVSLMLEQRRQVIEESHAAFQDEYCKHEHMAIGMMRGLAAIRALAAGEGNAE